MSPLASADLRLTELSRVISTSAIPISSSLTTSLEARYARQECGHWKQGGDHGGVAVV